jgi:basic amino acid/polyamine antiporter, APA family
VCGFAQLDFSSRRHPSSIKDDPHGNPSASIEAGRGGDGVSETISQPAGRRLFTRQASGLVREVSVSNALFFNTAAFVGTGVGWYPVFYTLAFIPVGSVLFTTYGWGAVIVGAFCVLLALIYASLSSVMPRSGGDYVFTTRLIPSVGPFLGWLESFTLVIASLAIIAFEVPIVLRNLQITGRIIGIGTGIGFFERANGWFADNGTIIGLPGFIGALIVLAGVFLVVIQPTRRFHGIVTALAIVSLLSAAVMFVFGLIFISKGSFAANLPTYADGMTVQQLAKAAADNGVRGSGAGILPLSLFAFMAGILLLNFIGFQYSAYIAGEVTGNVKRGILIAVLGALGIAVAMSSIYTDFLSYRVGLDVHLGWGVLFWLGDPQLPLGQPNSLPLVAEISRPGLWPVWAFVSLAGAIFPFLLCPVYINFISRLGLAWSLDRQVPEWFGDVNERLRAPINAILTALGLAVVFAVLQNFALLPKSIAPPDGHLNLVATLWFSILMAFLTWAMPGVNALIGPFARRDLMRNAPWRSVLPVIGVIWVVFIGWLYWFAGFKPIVDALGSAEESTLNYLNRTGLTFTLVFLGLGILIYVVQALRRRGALGSDTKLMYREIPPE